MIPENVANLTAIYAATLSTFLFLREIWKMQPKFDISHFFTGNPEEDDVITIYNKSNRTVFIKQFSIVKNGKDVDLGNEADFYIIRIQPHDIYSIKISQYYKFSIKGEVYLALNLIGKKKPVKIRI
ncbi:hypothetical protein F3J23_14430 [Chryseobacterium sp. Tr-659]|uniref:hypothetical protein n=1 Tax=Chryseobacterium sp. Tr-659 TaxID=2608340 RepID=UPI00141FFFCA|nr:hypothetical protein [Chryseobacterium sp. Tr-659]NIF06643.1 hypothetical protein [Chryseobacterium sp. Tr-659]